MDWALQQARARQVVISGFHSPLEQSVLKVLVATDSPAVVVLARPLQGAKLPPEWVDPLVKGHMTVLSGATTAGHLALQLAYERNAQVARLATKIVVPHARPGGSLAEQLGQWRLDGRQVEVLLAS